MPVHIAHHDLSAHLLIGNIVIEAEAIAFPLCIRQKRRIELEELFVCDGLDIKLTGFDREDQFIISICQRWMADRNIWIDLVRRLFSAFLYGSAQPDFRIISDHCSSLLCRLVCEWLSSSPQ